jgi:hypothetical protein
MLLKNAIASCCTGQIEGLSTQVLARLLKKGLLVRINHPLIQCNGKQNNPYLQPAAYADLVKAVEFRNRVLTINSCLRTVMQQHMLHQQKKNGWCGIKAASAPGQSNHQSGLSIDIEDVIGWKACLKRFNWFYIGDFDPMHFDHKSNQSKQLGRLQILEFQKLWNEYCSDSDRLTEDGVWGAKTAQAVANSPCEGFGSRGLKQGDYGNQVAELQFLLQQTLGLASIKIDSHFGAFTEQAVREFQRKHNLTVNGIASEETISLLKVVGHA